MSNRTALAALVVAEELLRERPAERCRPPRGPRKLPRSPLELVAGRMRGGRITALRAAGFPES